VEIAILLTMTYTTFIRTCRDWKEFANAPKDYQESGLTISQARENCADFNNNRTEAEIEAGTKMEFEQE
jgi:hypothetical protein